MSHDPPVLCGPPVLRFRGCQPGLKTCGSHAVVRHPIYASYLLIQSGYVLQSLSLRNLAVVTFASACTIARALARSKAARLVTGLPDLPRTGPVAADPLPAVTSGGWQRPRPVQPSASDTCSPLSASRETSGEIGAYSAGGPSPAATSIALSSLI